MTAASATPDQRPIYEVLAHAFHAEGVEAQFVLIGDGNMHWVNTLKDLPGVTTVHARHEHCACGMAMGHSSATGKVGVASVTCGPGVTQITTALVSAVRSHVPLVVFAGEAPVGARWYGQSVAQHALVTDCGAHYIAGHSPDLMQHYVREAFYVARSERRPVVLGVPYDLQKKMVPAPAPYVASASLLPPEPPIPPDPEQLREVARKLHAARCPIVLAGRGVLLADAEAAVADLADRCGALLATTLLARGMYDDHAFSLGVAGGFARAIAHEVFAKADFVLALGASMSSFTVDSGRLFPPSTEIVQIDARPVGLHHGRPTAHMHLRADARLAAIALTETLAAMGPSAAAVRDATLARRIREEPADDAPCEPDPGTLDPRAVFAELERVIPGDWDVVTGSGHQAYFHTVMRGGVPGRYHEMREFGAIGNALSHAAGVAVARGDGRVVLYEGDGSLLMHIQELECLRRQGIRLLVVCSNDGAYGAELHKLRNEGLDDGVAMFGRPDLASIARGFGLIGETVTEGGGFARLLEDYEAGDRAAIWDVHVSDKVMSPRLRRRAG